MAAHLSQNGESVTLWNRSKSTIEKLMRTNLIHAEGVIDGSTKLDSVTDDIGSALQGADVVFITTPANAHRYLAEAVAKHIESEVLIILNPGRTFGALEFRNTYEKFNTKHKPTIAEAQTIIYTCRKIEEDSVYIIALKEDVLLSTFDASKNEEIISCLPNCVKKYYKPANSMIETSIGNVGMILHCAPLILNTGWTESASNAYKYYYDGITPSVSSFLEKLDEERVAVSISMGHPVETLDKWLKRTYRVTGDSLYECLQNNEAYKLIDAPKTLNHRYIFEDIPCGLVPLEAVGSHYGISMNYTTLIIELASKLIKRNFRETGRNLSNLGLVDGVHHFLSNLEI